MDKKSIRTLMIQKRKDLSDNDYHDKSSSILQKVKEHEFYKQASTIGIYLSYNKEVETQSFIKQIEKEKKIVVPKVVGKQMTFHELDWNQLEISKYGIQEPMNSKLVDRHMIDLLIVPLVAYTSDGYRLGYGGGYYDRYLQDYKGHTIGIAFDFQQSSEFPIETHDLPLDVIITQKD